MNAGQANPALVAYWLPTVGIGEKDGIWKDVHVPLLDMLNGTRPDGSPQVTVAILGTATFLGTPETFTPPYLDIGELKTVLIPRTSDIKGPIRQLQAHGIKVLLSVVGTRSMGWDHVPTGKNEAFAQWIKTEILDQYGLDGIDIDNEFCVLPDNPQGMVDTVAALRAAAPQASISKALWKDRDDYFTQPVSQTSPWRAGSYLGQMLDFASTMYYGGRAAALEDFVQFVQSYTTIKVRDQNVGMAPGQLCVGVQAGDADHVDWMTTLAVTRDVTKWVVEHGYRGMMLYTFSQDIQQWTHWPQNSASYMFPHRDDHLWQRTIIDALDLLRCRPAPIIL